MHQLQQGVGDKEFAQKQFYSTLSHPPYAQCECSPRTRPPSPRSPRQFVAVPRGVAASQKCLVPHPFSLVNCAPDCFALLKINTKLLNRCVWHYWALELFDALLLQPAMLSKRRGLRRLEMRYWALPAKRRECAR